MRHFDHLGTAENTRLFFKEPEEFSNDSDPALLAAALGATLYMPGTRPNLAADIAKQSARGLTSVVVCLEDAIRDDEVPAAERNIISQLREYSAAGANSPLIFVRIRAIEQISMIVTGLGEHLGILAGFVLPKFLSSHGTAMLEAIEEASASTGHRLYAMPILESPEIAYIETRGAELQKIREVLTEHRSTVLAVRIGATDLCAAFGLRRNRELTIYHIRVIAEIIADIVNALGRPGESDFLISGPVWEYFAQPERIFKPQLRESPFALHDERSLREKILDADLDELIREIVLDQANGLTGKTVIHPSHVPAMHSLSVVSHEEYCDACDILGATTGGVQASEYRNKMNESRPHQAWAKRTHTRARAFGVLRAGISYVDVLSSNLASANTYQFEMPQVPVEPSGIATIEASP